MAKEDKKESSRRDNLSKYFYDLSKMTLAGTVLSMVPTIETKDYELTTMTILAFAVGLVVSIFFAVMGNKVMKY